MSSQLTAEMIREFYEKYGQKDEIVKKWTGIVNSVYAPDDNNTPQQVQEKLYPDNKVNVDPEYVYNVKKKLESLLRVLIERYKLEDFISVSDRFRLDLNKMLNSPYHELYEQKKDIRGNILRYGHDYIPTDFEDWLTIYLSDYAEAASIYTSMCQDKRIMKDDLLRLNEISKKYREKQ